MSDFIKELKWRNILNNITNEDKFIEAVKSNKAAYIGFDPSASSLHLGNYVMIMMLRRFSQFNIKCFALVGGATGMIGDPSGKSNERNLIDNNTLLNNKQGIINQLKKYGKVDILDNYDNFKDMNILEFLRDVGKLINVNYMLEKDIIKNRLDTGISFTEFTYTLIQGYDFLKYYKELNIAIQAGGSDQWGNITTGCEMIRKSVGDVNVACGLTINLLLKSDGTKFGKSEKGAIYLDEKLTSPYAMFQFLINQDDNDVINLLKFLTMLTEKEINEIESNSKKEPHLKIAQKILAELIVIDIHGPESFKIVNKISDTLFNGDISLLSESEIKQAFESIESTIIDNDSLTLTELLVKSNIAKSNRESRELITNNSITLNGVKVNDTEVGS